MLIKSATGEYHVDVSAITCLHKKQVSLPLDPDAKVFSVYAHVSCLSQRIPLLINVSEEVADAKINHISEQKDRY